VEQNETSESSSTGRSGLLDERGAWQINSQLPAPNFFIVGAAKAGTTSLYAYLSQHPEVYMSTLKEPHYFSSFVVRPEFDNFMPIIRDAGVYQELFLGSEGHKAVGDASPSYLCDAGAAVRIRSAIPHAKIIISLRNPVHRAYSHYLMDYRQGRETRPFRDALEADLARSEKGWGVSFQYVELGLYAEQVERYLKAFGHSKVLVILFEDLIRDTAVVMQQVALFLGIDPNGYPESTFDRAHNPFEVSRGPFVRSVLRSRPIRVWSKRWIPQKLRTAVRNRFLFTSGLKPRLDEKSRRFLIERFAPDLQRLERLLERDLDALREND
jgi:sulfotransferase family protein